jgi:hypothetical protein
MAHHDRTDDLADLVLGDQDVGAGLGSREMEVREGSL